jgi:hypothetical protein
MELLHVSGYKPHELTQQFVSLSNGTMVRFQHYAPWSDPAAGLYRGLDLLGTPNNMLGSVRGGRWHGNINLNTITEPEILQALCDAQNFSQPYFAYTTTDVANIFTKLITARNANGTANLLPTSDGYPFRSFASSSIADTWFRPAPSNPSQPLFAVGASTNHPYQRAALLQKIFNNITTTSNVFAVWWTVGYFEVVDESVRPARLGAEIGRSENRNIRHRFFAIVDRSGMQLFNTATTKGVTAGTGQSLSYTPPSGSAGSVPLAVQPGMLLEIDSGLNMEVVVVKSVNVVNGVSFFTADFTLNHAAGATIVCRGNPGPQTSYNPRRDSNVVLHLSVIQ